jgi:23S rRNA (pseudouridine1915-N3)-methyltransferase
MKITFVFSGKTKTGYIDKGIADYYSRLRHYVKTEICVIRDVKNTKNMSEKEQVQKEGENILKEIPAGGALILLDERGKKYSSVAFAEFLQKKIMEGRDIYLAIGGAYGFSDEVKKKADLEISLSEMTFSHQMVRLILLEQVYRAFTIMKGEPYHHA